jgi:hypothetical protein
MHEVCSVNGWRGLGHLTCLHQSWIALTDSGPWMLPSRRRNTSPWSVSYSCGSLWALGVCTVRRSTLAGAIAVQAVSHLTVAAPVQRRLLCTLAP